MAESFPKLPDRKLNLLLDFPSGSFSQKEIQEKLNLSKGYVSKWLNKLEKDGILARIGHSKPQFWEITPEGKRIIEANVSYASVGVCPKDFRLHNFSIQLPIIKDTSKGFWDKSWDMNGWKKQFKKLQDIGVSIERTPKTLTINFQAMDINEGELFGIMMMGTTAVMGHLARYGIELSFLGSKVSRQEYASPEPAVQEQTEKGMTFQTSLGRSQEKILPSDTPKDAKVWFDHSKGYPERDSNDLAHMRKAAAMPENVDNISKAVLGLWQLQGAYAEQIKVHLEVMNKISGMLTKFNKRLDQKSIKEFL